MSFLPLISSSLSPLRQLGPTDPLTVRWGPFVSFISYLRFLLLRCTRAYQGLLFGADAGGCQVDWRGHRTAVHPPSAARLASPAPRRPAPTRRDAASPVAGVRCGRPRSRHTASHRDCAAAGAERQAPFPLSLPNRAARMVSWLMLVGGFGGCCSSRAPKSQIPFPNGINMMA